MLNIELFSQILEFLALYLGEECEITLYDKEKVVLLENPMDDSKYIGAPLGEIEKSFINNPEYEDVPYSVNYRSLSSSGDKMRSATMFIRENDELIGLLNINKNVSDLIHFRKHIDTIINGGQDHNTFKSKTKNKSKPKEHYETLSLSVAEIINRVIEEATEKFGATPDRFTTNEKLSVIREMDKRGIFLAKGSVSEVADILGSSNATIYRYLQQVEK